MGGHTTPVFLNYPFWMAFNKINPDAYQDFVIVDGLQRITTMLEYLDDKVPVFDGYVASDLGDPRMADVTIQFNINNLKTHKEVLNWYLELNTGGTPHTEKDINKVKRLLAAIDGPDAVKDQYQLTSWTDDSDTQIREGDIIIADGYGDDPTETIDGSYHCVVWDDDYQTWGSNVYGDFDALSSYRTIKVVGHCEDLREQWEAGNVSGNIDNVLK